MLLHHWLHLSKHSEQWSGTALPRKFGPEWLPFGAAFFGLEVALWRPYGSRQMFPFDRSQGSGLRPSKGHSNWSVWPDSVNVMLCYLYLTADSWLETWLNPMDSKFAILNLSLNPRGSLLGKKLLRLGYAEIQSQLKCSFFTYLIRKCLNCFFSLTIPKCCSFLLLRCHVLCSTEMKGRFSRIPQ